MRLWHEGSNCIVLLTVPDEDALLRELDVICDAHIPFVVVTEPDIGDEHTAIAVAPSFDLGRRFSNLPLMGRGDLVAR